MTTSVQRLGFWSAILTSVLTIITFGIAVATPPLSGPYCVSGCYTYPYSDIASRFPRDYYWMYPAILLSLVFYVLMAAIHYSAPKEKRIFSHIGSSFALTSTAVFFIDYFLQVSVIQPSLLLGETDGISLLSQFNAHGVFIVLEEIGFFLMSLSLLFMAAVFSHKDNREKAIRWLFISSFILTLTAFILYSFIYGINREYRFEVAVISVNWLTLILSGVMLAGWFRQKMSLNQ